MAVSSPSDSLNTHPDSKAKGTSDMPPIIVCCAPLPVFLRNQPRRYTDGQSVITPIRTACPFLLPAQHTEFRKLLPSGTLIQRAHERRRRLCQRMHKLQSLQRAKRTHIPRVDERRRRRRPKGLAALTAPIEFQGATTPAKIVPQLQTTPAYGDNAADAAAASFHGSLSVCVCRRALLRPCHKCSRRPEGNSSSSNNNNSTE